MDQKLAEEVVQQQVAALGDTLAHHKQLLEEKLLEEVAGLRTDADKLKAKVWGRV